MKLVPVSFPEMYIVDRISILATDVGCSVLWRFMTYLFYDVFLHKITYPFSRINWHIFTAIIRNETRRSVDLFSV